MEEVFNEKASVISLKCLSYFENLELLCFQNPRVTFRWVKKMPGAEWLILISHAYHQLNKMLKNRPLLIPTYSAGDCDKSFNRRKTDTPFQPSSWKDPYNYSHLWKSPTLILPTSICEWQTHTKLVSYIHALVDRPSQRASHKIWNLWTPPPLVPIDVTEMELKGCLWKRYCCRAFRSCTSSLWKR